MGRFTLALCRRRWLAFPQASQPDQRLPDFSGHYRVIQDLGPGTLGQFLGRPVDPENKPVAEPSRLQEHLLARLISRRAFFSMSLQGFIFMLTLRRLGILFLLALSKVLATYCWSMGAG